MIGVQASLPKETVAMEYENATNDIVTREDPTAGTSQLDRASIHPNFGPPIPAA
jgi:hypothetical protein